MRPDLNLRGFAVGFPAAVIGLSGKFRRNRCFGIFRSAASLRGYSAKIFAIDTGLILIANPDAEEVLLAPDPRWLSPASRRLYLLHNDRHFCLSSPIDATLP